MTINPDQHRLHAQIRGIVQGVYFRETTRQKAQALHVKGWVRNLSDGSVEVTAEGSKPALDTLLEFLHKGPSRAYVESVAADWAAPTGEFASFEVRW